MPLGLQTGALASAFEDLFAGDTAPQTTEDAARRWAQIYKDYVVGGGVLVGPTAQTVLETNLTGAFRPELAGAGIPLTAAAIGTFWLTPPLQVPAQGNAVVVLFTPVGQPFPLPGQVPSTATVPQQAAALAQSLSAFTLASVLVLPAPPYAGPPIPIV